MMIVVVVVAYLDYPTMAASLFLLPAVAVAAAAADVAVVVVAP